MLYPKQPDAYPKVYRKETDTLLPERPDNRLRYMYFKTITKGGTCIISSCKDLHLRRTICHKMLKPELAKNPVECARFLREARVTAMLQHPNTIPTYELGRDVKGNYYFTMKLVHGSTLREIIDRCRNHNSHEIEGFDLFRLIDVISEACHALHYAHIHGVVHRDMKPENILVGEFGEVMVLDWGMAKVWDNDEMLAEIDQAQQDFSYKSFNIKDENLPLTQRAPLQGTPPYMSLEQLTRPSFVDYRTDIYSIGTLLFEVLALERMIEGNDVLTVIENIKKSVQISPSSRTPQLDIPEELEEVCLRCTHSDREKRYDSMEDVIHALEAWMNPIRIDRPLEV
ncbi:MAG: serine/threonine-protein kinase [Gammaproteobacteria bacterium]|nr:serine/threonine-protein kinase [Gammaproteobacteria bacterium]